MAIKFHHLLAPTVIQCGKLIGSNYLFGIIDIFSIKIGVEPWKREKKGEEWACIFNNIHLVEINDSVLVVFEFSVSQTHCNL